MSDFSHSIVLFTGEDGLPLEFNVRNTTNKEYLKALIEHGGGFCTQNENSVHLISPDTKVLNVGMGKMLVSSTYILDCVKENYLLDVNDYVFTISEAPTSDISDEDSDKLSMQRQSTCQSPNKRPAPVMNMEISPIKRPNQNHATECPKSYGLTLPSNYNSIPFCKSPSKQPAPAIIREKSPTKKPSQKNETGSTTSSNLTLPSSNNAVPQTSNSSSTHSESFVEGSQEVASNFKITSHVYYGDTSQNISTLPESPVNMHIALDIGSPSLVSPIKSVAAVTEISISASNFQSPITTPQTYLSPILSNLPENVSDMNLTPPRNASKWYTNATTITLSPLKTKDVREEIFKTSPSNLNNSNSLAENPELKSLTSSTKPIKNTKGDDSHIDSLEQNENILQLNIQENDRNIRLSCLQSPVNILSEVPVSHTVNLQDKSPIHIVSSSQPENDELDKFDNMLLSKVQRKTLSDDEESLSQSYTVSSSADAQINSKPCSAEDALPSSLEKNANDLPDSPNLSLSQMNVQDYLKNLEGEVEEILQKQSPKTLQDKIILVKYLCCARKLSPGTVLASLVTDPSELYL